MQLNRSRASDLAFLAVAAVVTLALQGAFSIWGPDPLAVFGDHVFLLSPARQMMDGQGFWSSNMIGFPLGQKAAYWPGFEPLLKFVLLLLAQLGFGVFTTVKLFYVVAIIGLTTSGYVCLRSLGLRNWSCAIGAVVFAASGYFAVRAVNHDFLSVYVAAAFGATFAIKIAGMQTEEEFSRYVKSPFFLIGMCIVATSGLYYAIFSLMTMGSAVASLYFKTLKIRPVLVFSAISLIVCVALFAGALGPDIALLLKGAPKRSPIEQFWHGLSIADAVYSFDWIPGTDSLLARFNRAREITLVGEGHHEWPGSLLTIVIIASPLIALWSMNNERNKERLMLIGPAAILICSGLIFASRGGTGYLFNSLITPALRGQSRLMPLLMFMAIYIVLAGTDFVWDQGKTAGRIAVSVVLVAVLASSVGTAGVLTKRMNYNKTDPLVIGLLASFKGVIAAKKAAGMTAVLQLPIASWPEIPQRNGYDFYTEHFGYILDDPGSKTRWSYGMSNRQPGFDEIAERFRFDNDPKNIPARARQTGFDGLLIEKKPFTPTELAELVGAIDATLPPACRLYDDADRVLYNIGTTPECRR